MQARGVAVAAENERARPRFQHIGEILRAHQRRRLVHVAVACNFLCYPRREVRLRGMIDGDGITALVLQLDLGARDLRDTIDCRAVISCEPTSTESMQMCGRAA